MPPSIGFDLHLHRFLLFFDLGMTYTIHGTRVTILVPMISYLREDRNDSSNSFDDLGESTDSKQQVSYFGPTFGPTVPGAWTFDKPLPRTPVLLKPGKDPKDPWKTFKDICEPKNFQHHKPQCDFHTSRYTRGVTTEDLDNDDSWNAPWIFEVTLLSESNSWMCGNELRKGIYGYIKFLHAHRTKHLDRSVSHTNLLKDEIRRNFSKKKLCVFVPLPLGSHDCVLFRCSNS